MPHREGEGEAQGQFLVLHLVLVQKVRDAFRDVVEELEDTARWLLGTGPSLAWGHSAFWGARPLTTWPILGSPPAVGWDSSPRLPDGSPGTV